MSLRDVTSWAVLMNHRSALPGARFDVVEQVGIRVGPLPPRRTPERKGSDKSNRGKEGYSGRVPLNTSHGMTVVLGAGLV